MREPDKKYCGVEDFDEEEYFDIDDEEEYCSWNNPYRVLPANSSSVIFNASAIFIAFVIVGIRSPVK